MIYNSFDKSFTKGFATSILITLNSIICIGQISDSLGQRMAGELEWKNSESVLGGLQDTLVKTKEFTSEQFLYRGIKNQVFVFCDSIACTNCDTLYPISKYKWELIPGGGKISRVMAFDSLKNELYKIKFPVAYIPDPTIFLGKTASGTRLKSVDRQISVDYRGGFKIDTEFEILSWSVVRGDAELDGDGTNLSEEAILFIEGIEDKEEFTVKVRIKDQLGVVRKLSGVFYK